jgi:hypothetical protein
MTERFGQTGLVAAHEQTTPAPSPVDKPRGDSNRQPAAPTQRRFLRWFSRREPDPNAIGDMRFINQLTLLISLKTFLLAEAVKISAEDAASFSFGRLNHLRYKEKGRLPTVEEWDAADKHSQTLFGYLDDDLKRRFRLKQATDLIAGLPVVFLILALVSLIGAVFIPDRSLLFMAYCSWTVFLGALGAMAFLSVNALSIQSEETFDLTNKSLLAVRIVSGSLFGVVLSIPVGFDSFVTFVESIAVKASSLEAPNTAIGFSMQAAVLLLPFLLGFSTSVVMLVMNRLVESLVVFFGGTYGKKA